MSKTPKYLTESVLLWVWNSGASNQDDMGFLGAIMDLKCLI